MLRVVCRLSCKIYPDQNTTSPISDSCTHLFSVIDTHSLGWEIRGNVLDAKVAEIMQNLKDSDWHPDSFLRISRDGR